MKVILLPLKSRSCWLPPQAADPLRKSLPPAVNRCQMTETIPHHHSTVKSLANSRHGTYCCVGVKGTPELQTRLKRMGICDRRTIIVLQAGDPMIISVVGAKIAVSRYLAECVQVGDAELAVGASVEVNTEAGTA